MKTFKPSNLLLLFLFSAGLSFFIACQKSDNSMPPGPVIPPIKNKLAYIYKTDSTEAKEYKDLMQVNGCSVTLIDLSAVATANFSTYNMIVVGGNTATPSVSWTSADSLAIASAAKPLLLIGVGGFRLGDKLGLKVNWGQSAISAETNMNALNGSSTLYTKPKTISISSGQVTLYNSTTTWVGRIFIPPPAPSDVELFGQAPSATSYYPILVQTGKCGGWGYYGPVNAMTQAGKDLMVNFSYYVGNLAL